MNNLKYIDFLKRFVSFFVTTVFLKNLFCFVLLFCFSVSNGVNIKELLY